MTELPSNPLHITPAELVVLNLIVAGCTHKALALELGNSVKTIEKHKQSIYRKFGVGCSLDLARAAIYWDYVDLITFLEPLRRSKRAMVRK
jgi:DNA-binding NarL/FixJ family response regulator